jgi:hypothetical protein
MLADKAELREEGTGGDGEKPMTLYGDLARFNEWAEVDTYNGSYLERIAPGAFDKTLKESRASLKVLFNHGMDAQLGQKMLGQITDLRTTKNAVQYEVRLFDGLRTEHPLLLDGLRAGEYGSSFKFEVINDERERGDPPRRTITELKLYEFGPVTFPAYKAATAGVRSQADMWIWEKLDETGREELVRLLFKATSAMEAATGTSTREAGKETSSEPEASTPFTRYREAAERFDEWRQKGYGDRVS